MYRAAVEEVPNDPVLFSLGKAEVVKKGKDITLIGWGTQVHVLLDTAKVAEEKLGVDCEVIDMVSILPWDKETVFKVSTKEIN